MEYRAIKKDKIKEIVLLLDLFDGKLSLADILNTDISLLNQLRDAKLEIIDQTSRSNKSSVQLTSLDEVKNRIKL